MDRREFIAAAPLGTEPFLAAELKDLGASASDARVAAVAFEGTLETALAACLWSRLASRILMPLATFRADSAEALYVRAHAIAWEEHLGPDDTLAVDATLKRAPESLAHSAFCALKVKDAIVDRLRAVHGRRPSIDTARPTLRVYLHMTGERARVGIDLSGEPLHRRGYRSETGPAPLKENLAAALLLASGWPVIARAGGACIDPLCGSGTIAIEAALIAHDIAPGLRREYWGFTGWRGHDPSLWKRLMDEACERRDAGLERPSVIAGSDADERVLAIARRNAEHAGLSGHITFTHAPLAAFTSTATHGLIATNPPWGERLAAHESLRVYAELGALLASRGKDFHAAVLVATDAQERALGLGTAHVLDLPCGPVRTRLVIAEPRLADKVTHTTTGIRDDAAQDFANRLRKNARERERYARQERTDCYRLYDADLPDYAFAIDRYGEHVRVQEYAAPKTIDPARAAARRAAALRIIPEVLGVDAHAVSYRLRERQKGHSQYEKIDAQGHFIEVREGPARYLVNLDDYLDTGIFLDHRLTRALIAELADGKRFLNLFCYTATATVRAALGGAASSTSVDLSNTYLDWAEENFALNALDERRHRLVRADCLRWLQETRDRYDLIFLDPPTFSRSKGMEDTFDVLRDQATFLPLVVARLAPGGTLLFSTNAQRFTLDETALTGCTIEDLTRRTIPRDFARTPKAHRLWRIGR